MLPSKAAPASTGGPGMVCNASPRLPTPPVAATIRRAMCQTLSAAQAPPHKTLLTAGLMRTMIAIAGSLAAYFGYFQWCVERVSTFKHLLRVARR